MKRICSLMSVMFLLLVLGCDKLPTPAAKKQYKLTIENQWRNEVTVYVDGSEFMKVPGKATKTQGGIDQGKHTISFLTDGAYYPPVELNFDGDKTYVLLYPGLAG